MGLNQIPIPGPRGVPILGNVYDIEKEVPLNSLELLADSYGMLQYLSIPCIWVCMYRAVELICKGPIYRLTILGSTRVIVTSQELAEEVCDEERFTKAVVAGLKEIRNGVHDGLFTANYPGEENWAVAHRVLVPAFGPLSIRGMFDGKSSNKHI